MHQHQRFSKSGSSPLDALTHPIESTPSNPTSSKSIDSVKLTTRQNSEIETNLNKIISASNSAIEATKVVGGFIDSIAGIVELAESKSQSQERLKTLTNEANELILKLEETEINNTNNLVVNSESDLINQQIINIGETLSNLLPINNISEKKFGVNLVDFSTLGGIQRAKDNVLKAKEKFDLIQKTTNDASNNLKQVLINLEVAKQNSEASQSSVRDLNEALELADSMSNNIKNNKNDALNSFKEINPKSLDLLN